MKAFHYEEVQPQKVEEDVRGTVSIRWLITREMGAENFAMRLFEMEPGSETGPRSHEWEHEVFILEGNGVMTGADREFELSSGSVVFIPGNEPHKLHNTGTSTMKYVCLVPLMKTGA